MDPPTLASKLVSGIDKGLTPMRDGHCVINYHDFLFNATHLNNTVVFQDEYKLGHCEWADSRLDSVLVERSYCFKRTVDRWVHEVILC